MGFRWKKLLNPRMLALLGAGWFLAPLALYLLIFHYSPKVLLIMLAIGAVYILIFLWFLARIKEA